MKRILLFLIGLLMPLVSVAQQGAVTYDRAVNHDFEIPDFLKDMRDEIPMQSVATMVLLFYGPESLTKEAPPEDEAGSAGDAGIGRAIARGMAFRLRMGSSSRNDRENFREIYVNREDGSFVETRDFLGRTFLLSGEQPSYAWKLNEEESEFMGYMVQKATAQHDTTRIEAWFTPEIPVPIGPGLFGGLPGLILVVSVDEGRIVYSATGVKLGGIQEGLIKEPEEGRKVTMDEYEKIVEEKLKEMRSQRRRRIR